MNSAELAFEQQAMRERAAAAAAPAPEKIKPIKIPAVIQATAAEISNRSTDVAVYVRHIDCKYTDRESNEKCGCPFWLYDKLSRKRCTARTNIRSKAEAEAQRIMDSRDPVKRKIAELEKKREYETVLIQTALEKYIMDCEQRGLAPETLEAYECAVEQMRDYAHSQRVFALGEITPRLLKEWRAAWPDKRKTSKQKKQNQIKTFFTWVCEEMKWLDLNNNPALGLGKIGGKHEVTAVPFTEAQYNAILDATYIYENSNRFRDAAARLRALIQLQRWSGLAIRDALTLPRWKIKDGVLQVHRAKTGTPVTVPLPPKVLEDLNALKNDNPEYFFWSGSAKPRALVGDYNRMFSRLWKLVKWPTPVVDGHQKPVSPHSHMFRHTFAHHWLQTGGDIRDLQLLFCYNGPATTEKHYAGFMPNEAERLNTEVRARWAAQNAPGVAKPEAPAPPEPEHHIRVRVRQRASRR